MDLYQILNVIKTLESTDFPFAGKQTGQKPGDQVRGTEPAQVKKSGEHPFHGRLVGASESAKDYGDPKESDLTQHDLLFKTAIKAVFDAARENVNIDFDDAIRMVSKAYNIPYAPSSLPGLQQKLAKIEAEIETYKKVRANQLDRQKEKLTHQSSPEELKRDQQWMKNYGDRLTQAMRLRSGVKEQWEQFVNEYGMTTGGTANPDAQKQLAQQTSQQQQAVNKLKNAGANIPNVTQAVKTTLKDPTKDPVSGQDRDVLAGLGQEMDAMLSSDDPAVVNQLAALVRRTKQQPASGKE
jgi:hypothetical protein